MSLFGFHRNMSKILRKENSKKRNFDLTLLLLPLLKSIPGVSVIDG